MSSRVATSEAQFKLLSDDLDELLDHLVLALQIGVARHAGAQADGRPSFHEHLCQVFVGDRFLKGGIGERARLRIQ